MKSNKVKISRFHIISFLVICFFFYVDFIFTWLRGAHAGRERECVLTLCEAHRYSRSNTHTVKRIDTIQAERLKSNDFQALCSRCSRGSRLSLFGFTSAVGISRSSCTCLNSSNSSDHNHMGPLCWSFIERYFKSQNLYYLENI